MNKKLIAVAVAAAFAAPMAASADATIYGAIDTAIGFNDVEVDGTVQGATAVDNQTVDGIDGALGIKGSEDLGNGLSAIYKFEINYDPDNGSISGTADEVWVGLAGDWGAVALGREDHPYKNVLNASGYNPSGDRLNDMDAISGRVGGVGFRQETTSNGVVYISPNLSGFSGQAAAVAVEGTGQSGALTNDGFDAFSLGVNYAGGGLKVGLAYEDIDVATSAGETAGLGNSESYVLAASYTFGDFKVGAAYEDTEDAAQRSSGPAGGGFNLVASDVETWGLSGAATFGNNVITLTYVDEEQEGVAGVSGNDAEITSWGISAQHNLSNRTGVYASFRDAENEGQGGLSGNDAEDTSFNVGIVHSF